VAGALTLRELSRLASKGYDCHSEGGVCPRNPDESHR